MAADKPYTFLGKPISGRFTIGSGIITTTVDIIKRLADEIPEIGVLTTKSIGPSERDGNREPVYAELCDGRPGWINAVGLGNPGHVLFEQELQTLKLPEDKFLLISIFGGTTDDFVEVAKLLHPHADALELNFSCPHAAGHGLAICQTPGLAAEIVTAVKAVTDKPIIPKLSPNLELAVIDELVKSLLDAGAAAFTACNTLGPFENKHPDTDTNVISIGKGGMSGAAAKESMVKIVQHLRKVLDANDAKHVPIIGMGGITNWEDCQEYLDAGSTILGVGSSLTGLDTETLKTHFEALGKGTNPFLVAPPSMQLKPFTLKKKDLVNPRLALLEFEEVLPCRAGQFLELWIPGHGEKPYAQSSETPLQLAIGDVGILSHEIVANTELGSKIYIRGPYGKPFRQTAENETSEEPIIHVLVGGGTGIAPLLLLATQIKKSITQRPTKVWVYLGGRTKEHVYYEAEFSKICDRVVIATNDGSAGFQGFVTQALEKDLEENKDATYRFYNCGPELMMVAAVKVQKNYKRECMECSIERYMKCGVGICGVCSCDGYRTCVDGPIWGEDRIDASEMFGKKHRAKNAKLIDW